MYIFIVYIAYVYIQHEDKKSVNIKKIVRLVHVVKMESAFFPLIVFQKII